MPSIETHAEPGIRFGDMLRLPILAESNLGPGANFMIDEARRAESLRMYMPKPRAVEARVATYAQLLRQALTATALSTTIEAGLTARQVA